MTLWQRLRFILFGHWPRSRHVVVPGNDLPDGQAQQVKAEWLRALATNPAFIWLMSDLEDKKATHEDRLRSHVGVASLVAQDGIDGLLKYGMAAAKTEEAVFWLGYIQHLVRRAEALPEMKQRPPAINQVQ